MMMMKFFSIVNLALKSCCKKTKAASNHSFPFIKIENKKRHPYLCVVEADYPFEFLIRGLQNMQGIFIDRCSS